MRAAFLIRCSTKKQDYERQVNDLTRLAKKFGYTSSDNMIFGEHITGKDDASKRDRQSIQRLKDAAINKEFDVVLVSEVSRMSRDPMSGRLYVRQLINMDIPVYFRDIDTWTIDPVTGKKVRDAETIIGAAFDAAWKYIKSMKTQIASGRRDELDNNQMSIGQPFFGYKRYGGRDKGKKNSWVINDDAAKVVVDVFEEYVKDGATLKSTTLAITAKYGEQFNKKFSIGTIEHILTFEPYCTGIKVVSLTDPDTEDVDEFEVEIPTIITRAMFDKATTKRATNRTARTPYPKQATYILSKLLKCPICEHSLTPQKRGGDKGDKYRLMNGKVAIRWSCMSGINNATDCSSRITISNEKLEAIIWGLVKQELIGFANLNDEDRVAKVEELTDKITNLEMNIANFTSHISNMDRLIERAYSAYMDAPDSVMDIAKDKYYKTLTKCENERAECKDKIEALSAEKLRLENMRTFFNQPTLPKDAIEKAESDPIKMRNLVMELIDKIYPYRITTYVSPATNRIMRNGIVLLEVYTINGIYNVLYDGNQRNNKVAYYISSVYATFQNGRNKFDAYDTGEYFVISHATLVTETEDVDMLVTFNELIKICMQNGWEIDYTYKM